MTIRVTSHGGNVCGCKHIFGFSSAGPSVPLFEQKGENFYYKGGDLKGQRLYGYANDLFLGVGENFPKQSGEDRLRAMVEKLVLTYRGHRIEVVLKCGRRDPKNLTPKQIAKNWPSSGQIQWEPLLLELGFERVGKDFYNSNSGNWLRTYHLIITPEMHERVHKEVSLRNKKEKSLFR